jgi:hypothetical protein
MAVQGLMSGGFSADGEGFTPGSFMGFLFAEGAGIVMGVAMVRSKIFSTLTAWTGLLGSVLLLIFTTWTTFVATRFDVAMLVAMSGGLLSMSWLVLVARRIFQFTQGGANADFRP